MADLDDFFAKKDKKKSKAKPKFLTAEELVKNLEDTTKKEVAAKIKNKPDVTQAVNANIVSAGAEEEKAAVIEQEPVVEEEWKEFEEEQRKDYTGLKIGQMTLNDDDDSSPADNEDDEDSDGNVITESGGGKRAGGGPWKKVIPAEDVVQIPMDMPKAVVTTPAATSNNKYVSPGLRMQQNQPQPLAPIRLKARNRTAPDITNADYFPSLGAARPEEQRKKKNEPAFEEVRHGGRVQRVQETTVAAPVTATNRFQSLDDDS